MTKQQFLKLLGEGELESEIGFAVEPDNEVVPVSVYTDDDGKLWVDLGQL